MRTTLALLLVVAGCGGSTSSTTELLSGFNPPPAPANGFQVILPIVHNLQPGSDNEMCTWTDKILDHDMDLRSVAAFQSAGGHHVVLYATKVQQAPGTTRVCTNDDMISFNFIAVAGGEGSAQTSTPPDGLVYRIPAGSQLVLNHHYINASPKTIDAQSAFNVELADPSKTYTPVGYLFFADTQFKLDAGNPSLDINCTVQRDQSAWLLLPHMHAFGTRITIDHTSDGQTTQLFDINPWKPDFAFHPPLIREELATPHQFKKGDEVHVHCEWQAPQALDFGIEMCVLFTETVDDQGIGNQVCDRGSWHSF